MYQSETSLIRKELVKDKYVNYFVGKGLDVGCAGDILFKNMRGFDLPIPYARCGDDNIDYVGDARNLNAYFPREYWDFLYSSHLLEDFPNTEEILEHWMQVVKKGGYIILYLPHEMKYRKHCEKTGQPYNKAHQVTEMSYEYMEKIGNKLNLKTVDGLESHGEYSFLIIFQTPEG